MIDPELSSQFSSIVEGQLDPELFSLTDEEIAQGRKAREETIKQAGEELAPYFVKMWREEMWPEVTEFVDELLVRYGLEISDIRAIAEAADRAIAEKGEAYFGQA